MSYRSLAPRSLGTTAALFAAWVLLSPPLYSQQPPEEEEAASQEEVAPQEEEPAPEEPAEPEPEPQPVEPQPEPEPAPPGGGRLEVDPEVASPTRLQVDQESGDLVRLPFDHPFTVVLSLGALDLGDLEPSLRFLVFRKRLDVVPDNVCDSERQASFAGISTATESGRTARKARFIMPALDPNRYVVFCFQTTAQISAQLSLSERQALASAFKAALAQLETEIETADFEERRAEFVAALEAALSSFARREGLGGTVRLARGFSLEDLMRDFRVPRQAMLQCDLEVLQRLKGSFVGRARSLWENSIRSLAGSSPARLDLESCRRLYETGLAEAIVQGEETIIDNLQAAKADLDNLEPSLDAFAQTAIRAVQARNSLFLATSLPATSVARRYVSADGGFAFVPHLDQSLTFTGVNIYLRPVNPPSVTPLGWGRKGIARRTSLTIGLTVNEDLVRKDTIGGVETKIVDDLTTMGSPLLGIGFRLNPALRVEAGAIAYKQLDTLISQTPKTEVNWYLALSLDMDVASLFTDGKNSLFNGGTPTP